MRRQKQTQTQTTPKQYCLVCGKLKINTIIERDFFEIFEFPVFKPYSTQSKLL